MSEQYYDTLHSFLKQSNVSDMDFADRIRMFSEMFKELLNTRSKMTAGTFMSVMVGCKGIIEEKENPEEQEKLHSLYSQLFREYLDECEESFLTITNPHFIQRIQDMASFGNEDLHAAVRQIYHPNEVPAKPAAEPAVKPAAEPDPNPLTVLSLIMKELNEEGQQELIRRARELTYIPTYKKLS